MKQIKSLGTIGSILLLGAIIPVIGPILSFAGFVMVIIAVYQISKLSGEKSIFRDYLLSVILGGVIPVLLASLGGVSVISEINKEGRGLVTIGILAIVAIWLAVIAGGWFLKKSFTKIAEISKVSAFKTTGNLYFVGSILLFLFGVGGILILISLIFQIIAFSSFPLVFPAQA